MSYRIRTVAEMTGIPRNTLIAWERRYGFISPQRHGNGYRSYSDRDIDVLRRVQNAMHAGMKISEAVELLQKEDAHGASAPVETQETNRLAGDAYVNLTQDLAEALLSYRREHADNILAQLTPLPFGTRLHKIFFPVLREIGDRWERGDVTIAQEHYASAVLRTHLSGFLAGLGTRGKSAPHAACTTITGDLHEMAALALSIQLSLGGHRVSYLGPNLPSEEVVDFCVSQKVQLMCVSVIASPKPATFQTYLNHVAQAVPSGTRIAIGGRHTAQLKCSVPAGVAIIPRWDDFKLLW